jgi:hypothetical protein
MSHAHVGLAENRASERRKNNGRQLPASACCSPALEPSRLWGSISTLGFT